MAYLLTPELISPARVVPFCLPEAAGFEVPQVKLPNPAAARRINRAIVRQMLVEPAELDSAVLEPARALRQVLAACCTNEDGQPQPGQGLTGVSYRVLRNSNRLLSFEYSLEFTGAYTYGTIRHATFDISTGQLLRLADIVDNPRSQLQLHLRKAINRRIKATLTDALQDQNDSDGMSSLIERFNWDVKTQQVRFGDAGGPVLNDFAVSEQGIKLFYAPWLPPSLWSYAPDSAYVFPLERSRLQPAWQHLLKTSRR